MSGLLDMNANGQTKQPIGVQQSKNNSSVKSEEVVCVLDLRPALPDGSRSPRSRSTFRRRPDLVVGIPVVIANLRFAAVIPVARFQENLRAMICQSLLLRDYSFSLPPFQSASMRHLISRVY